MILLGVQKLYKEDCFELYDIQKVKPGISITLSYMDSHGFWMMYIIKGVRKQQEVAVYIYVRRVVVGIRVFVCVCVVVFISI